MDIHTIAKSITIYTNGGETVINTVRRFPGYGWVWCEPHGIMNIIALTNTKKRYIVAYNSKSSGGGKFIAHVPHASIMFQQSPSGLYFHNMRNSDVVAFTQYNVATMQGNAEGYTPPPVHDCPPNRCRFVYHGEMQYAKKLPCFRPQHRLC